MHAFLPAGDVIPLALTAANADAAAGRAARAASGCGGSVSGGGVGGAGLGVADGSGESPPGSGTH